MLWINKQFKTAQTLIVTVGFDYFIERYELYLLMQRGVLKIKHN